MKMIMPISPPLLLPCVTVVYSHSEIVNCRLSAFIVCAPVPNAYLNAMPTNCVDLFETKIEQLADVIESSLCRFGKIKPYYSGGKQGEAFDQALATLTEQEDVSSKVRLCLMDTQRALSFWYAKHVCQPASWSKRAVLRDIESLQPHNESLFQK